MSPRWALASYSCILGKFELNSEIENSSSWSLHINGYKDNDDDDNNSSEIQQINVARIFKYPQVKIRQIFIFKANYGYFNFPFPIDEIQAFLIFGRCCIVGIG